MQNYTYSMGMLVGILLLLVSCQKNHDQKDSNSITLNKNEIIDEHFLTQELQSKLSPDTVYSILKERNKEYVEDNLTIRNTSERIRKASIGQYPAAVVLSCLDSRVPVEDVFHSGIGDLFVARVAGNVSNEDILGSLEYACKVSGAKVVVVLGHEHCGAIKSAIDNVELGNITGLLAKIKPAIAATPYNGDRTSKNHAYIEAVTKSNVLHTMEEIRKNSPILKEMEDKKEIKIVGGEYHMETGKVEFLSK
ncbi:carbonic anhydrase family protein [Chryseobacterium sp.]|uniref:carbonic anhydrase family protein n=1 Tax=Chryseobacterium sp. TaxID=1871047 RepID=UPI0025BC0D7C|nr:carbonic anhydrase family protein [Chryseobacterium sp.]